MVFLRPKGGRAPQCPPSGSAPAAGHLHEFYLQVSGRQNFGQVLSHSGSWFIPVSPVGVAASDVMVTAVAPGQFLLKAPWVAGPLVDINKSQRQHWAFSTARGHEGPEMLSGDLKCPAKEAPCSGASGKTGVSRTLRMEGTYLNSTLAWTVCTPLVYRVLLVAGNELMTSSGRMKGGDYI